MISKFILIFSVFQLISAEYKLVFEDEFNGNVLNENNWKYETGAEPNWGNHELQYYTAHKTKNVRVENGHLVIEAQIQEIRLKQGIFLATAHPEDINGKHFTSGRLDSKHGWTFGKFEARARLPKGRHLWPAIWLMPQQDNYGDWPASGEIDIMESRGEKSDTVEATVHYGGPYPNNSFSGSPETKFSDLSIDFHLFTFEWTSSQMIWSIDNKEYFRTNINRNLWSGKGHNPYTKAGQPFDKPFYWIMNVAVGGDFFPEDEYGKQVTPEEAKHWSKPTMEVDFIRVYQQN